MERCVLKLFDVLGGFWASLNWFSQDSHIDDQILIIVNLKLRIGEWMKRYYALQQYLNRSQGETDKSASEGNV